MQKTLLVIVLLVFNNLTYSASERPEPVTPSPEEVFWKKVRAYPYTMVIKSKRYGEFNFTFEADKALEGYRQLCRETNYSMEIPCVALVNKNKEIVDLVYPPMENMFLLDIDKEKIYEYNLENSSLIEGLTKSSITPDQRDDMIQRIVANAIYHPLGRFCLGKKNNRIMILAEVLNQKVFLPIECINTPLNRLIQSKKITGLPDREIIDFIYKMTKGYPPNEFITIEDFPLRKDWYIVTTPNTCFWTDYFINYVEIESRKLDIDMKIPIHLHPWVQMQWLVYTPERYWLSEYQIHLIPSGKDLEFFKSRYPDSKLYIIMGRDLYSDELDWAIYDDIPLIETQMQKLELSARDNFHLKAILEHLRDSRGTIQRYYTRKDKGLVVNKEIDTLLLLNKRQKGVLKEIEGYKKDYSWRLINTSFFIPVLNEQLARKGWKVISRDKGAIGYDLDKREFYYAEGLTARMKLFLYILFKLCYIDENDLPGGLDREAYTIAFLEDISNQLDYLCIKYNHIEGFRKHMEYLSCIIRHNIWQREKEIYIAKEQINNGRYYLDRYNLGYYKQGIDLKVVSNITFQQKVMILELEGIVKELAKRFDIKNVEEFIMEFEKQLIIRIFQNKQILLD